MHKKLIPFDLLESVEPIILANKRLIGHKDEENCYYSLYDKEQGSGFYFKMYVDSKKINVKSSDERNTILCEFSPFTLNDVAPNRMFIKRNVVKDQLITWLTYLNKYNDILSIYDDPFIKEYQSYYYEEFKIVDEDADTVPFNPQQQGGIERYLEFVAKKLIRYKPKNEDEVIIINDIVNEVRDTENNLQHLTKNQVIAKLARIWAKTYKWSKKQAKEILKKAQEELVKELMKEGVRNLISAATESNN